MAQFKNQRSDRNFAIDAKDLGLSSKYRDIRSEAEVKKAYQRGDWDRIADAENED
jgi:hypothetical protein